ncbi:molybdopterin-binding protein [Streptomyces brasiliensis]|nr:molybdopterin-binding protein [Streptomyces brasiliensis]
MAWPDAHRIAWEIAEPLGQSTVDLAAAQGHLLAQPLHAAVPLPSCDTAAMDGYAVAGDGPWTVVGRLLAGDRPHPGPLQPGQAVEIATGAPVMSGAAAVLPVERMQRHGDIVTGTPGGRSHIRYRGEDIAEGDELLPEGAVVTPAVLGLAASVGNDTLRVHRRPRVRVAVTGDELRRYGRPGPGQVRDAIGPMLPGLIGCSGGDLVGVDHLSDDRCAFDRMLAETEADVVVVSGSTSVGAADHLRAALRARRAHLHVNGVACRPGHPQLLAGLPDGRYVVGLPGNPFAALVAALTILEPLLARLGSRPARPMPTAALVPGPSAHPRDTVLLAAVWRGGSLEQVGRDRPGSLWGAALADALAVLPPGWRGPDVGVLALAGGSPGLSAEARAATFPRMLRAGSYGPRSGARSLSCSRPPSLAEFEGGP